MNILRFDNPSDKWAESIPLNRSRSTPVYVHPYDIVIGPIADDGVAYLLGRYEEGTFSLEELAQGLKYMKLNSQYFFGTEKTINHLKRIL